MASVPQSMMMVKSKKKKIEKGIFLQADNNEQRYNNKMMDSIWGQYNRYSVHNMKSMQSEEALDTSTPPVIQIMQEHEYQVERSASPILQMIQGQEIGRSRPLHRVMQQHQRECERSRSPSLTELFKDDDERLSRSCSPFMQQIINDYRVDMHRSSSPLTQLAQEHYEGMNPTLGNQESNQEEMSYAEPGIYQNSIQFHNPVGHSGSNMLCN